MSGRPPRCDEGATGRGRVLRLENLEQRIVLSAAGWSGESNLAGLEDSLAQETSVATGSGGDSPVTLATTINISTPHQGFDPAPAEILALGFREFSAVDPADIHYLTEQQIASIPNNNWLTKISVEARANLTVKQVRALQVDIFGVSQLLPEQVTYLSTAQIQSLAFGNFRFLTANEVVRLTPAQVATIPSIGVLNAMSSAARAALTEPQIQALNIAVVGLSKLTSTQVSYLTPEQIQSVDYSQFQYLGQNEIIHLTPAQVSTIPTIEWFSGIPSASRAALGQSQVKALNVAVLGLSQLTSEQIHYLSPSQIQTLDFTQFHFLGPAEIIHLLPAQVGSIPTTQWLDGIPSASRAALGQAQVQALNVAVLGLSKLTPQQVSFLSRSQVQSIDYTQFNFLGPDQVVHLTPVQIASIPTIQWFNGIPSATRAAFTEVQVQALNMTIIGITSLTGAQRQWLTASQVASLSEVEFIHLSASQIPHLTNEQIASISTISTIAQMTDAAQAALTREQQLYLDPSIRASYNRVPQPIADPTDFTNPNTIPPAEDGLAGDQRTLNEANGIMALVPLEVVTHATVRSGNWSNPATWQAGVVPTTGADVLVAAGHTVVFDANMTAPIRTLRVDGTLTFATQQDTTMLVDTVVVTVTGKFQVGTAQQPIADDVTARIVFSEGAIDTTWDPRLISRGLISRGEFRAYGREVESFVAIATIGSATQLVLDHTPVGWEVGDKLLITGTKVFANQEEERKILSIVGNTVIVSPLQYTHEPPTGYGLTVHVANLTRNVIFESANPDVIAQHGHMMFAHNPNVELVHTSLIGLGRTDKSIPINDPAVVDGILQPGTGLNRRARYPVHFHRTGVDPTSTPALVRGNAVWTSPGWGVVNHSSYVLVEDNVVFDVTGAAFATEDGNEIGAFHRNLAIRGQGSGNHILSRSAIHDWGHGGYGFWFQGPGVEAVDNIATGQGAAGFLFFTASSRNLFSAENIDPALSFGLSTLPVSSVPLAKVSGNVAYGSARGMDVWFHMMNLPDGQSLIEDFTAWNLSSSGMFLFYVGQTTIRNVLLLGNLNNPAETAIATNDASHGITYRNVRVEGFATGIDAPERRAATIDGGYFAAVRAISIPQAREATRSLEVINNPTFETLTPSQLDGREQYDIYIRDAPVLTSNDLSAYFNSDFAPLGRIIVNGKQLYHGEQARNFVPFSADDADPQIPTVLIGKTNAQLWDSHGIAVAGFRAPFGATSAPRINGLVGSFTMPPAPLRYVSPKNVSVTEDYLLEYLNELGDVVRDSTPVTLQPGWNMLTRVVDRQTRTFFVFGIG